MTLNILMASQRAMHLSGDFCFTTGKVSATELNSQKLFAVGRYDWSGIISFCGLARTTTGVRVDSWIAKQIDLGEDNESVDELIDRLINGGRAWLPRVATKDRYLTICVCGFHERSPFAFCLSTFESFDGLLSNRPRSKLHPDGIKPTAPRLFVFGQSDVVKKQSRDFLKASYRKESNRLFSRSIANVNEEVSNANSTVSSECVVGFVTAAGSGEVCTFGLSDDELYLPDFVKRDFEARGIQGWRSTDGTPTLPHWRGMTLARKRVEGRGQIIVGIHAIANIEHAEIVMLPSARKEGALFSRIADGTEGKSVTLNPEWASGRRHVPKTKRPRRLRKK